MTVLAQSRIKDNDSFGRALRTGSLLWASRELAAREALDPALLDPVKRLEYCSMLAQQGPATNTIAHVNQKYCWRQRAWAALADVLRRVNYVCFAL